MRQSEQYELEKSIICCILQKNSLINELFVDLKCFENGKNVRLLLFLKKFYLEYKKLDLTLMMTKISDQREQEQFVNYYLEVIGMEPSTQVFYEYQQELINRYRDKLIKNEIRKYENNKLSLDELVGIINKIYNEVMVVKSNNKRTPEEMLHMIRNREKLIVFSRFLTLNEKLKIKKRTVNVIGARPSEGKSALAINLFCDLAKEYKCIYFNMEMTEEEVYERMLGIEANITIDDINKPQTEYQDKAILEVANKIYNYKYEVVNGSKTVQSMKNKIIKDKLFLFFNAI